MQMRPILEAVWSFEQAVPAKKQPDIAGAGGILEMDDKLNRNFIPGSGRSRLRRNLGSSSWKSGQVMPKLR